MPARFPDGGVLPLISQEPQEQKEALQEIVISGISGRFPESDNMQEFSENLFNGVDMVTDDGRRWEPGTFGLPLRSGKLKTLDKFDASFFGVHGKQADVMDPQLRMMLEITHEAIMDSGTNPADIRGSRTGVFIGASTSESEEAFSSDPETVNGYGLTGCCKAMFANRVSFAFDFKGPSFVVDTACSSSLLAFHHAIVAMRTGQCDSAIVGGLHLCLKPNTALQFHRLSMLSKDGACKAFDSTGNGYVRSEAAVAVFLQNNKAANRIYATVVHTKSNTDGNKSQGVTFPSGQVQKELLQEIYSEAGVLPTSVSYVEAHGTGTKVGDPQEINAIADVFCTGRDQNKPLMIGSVKSNMGHSEPASGLCSLAKVVIAMEAKKIPGNLHFKNPNPNIPALNDGRIKVIASNTPWAGGLVGINSFGFGGANVHAIFRSASVDKKPKNYLRRPSQAANLPRFVVASSRTEEGVQTILDGVTSEKPGLADILYKTQDVANNTYRGHKLITDSNTSTQDIQACNVTAPPVWFIFTGMGAQWTGMGRDLLQLDVFKNSIQKCHEVLAPFGVDLFKLISDENETFNSTLNSFVSIAATHVALIDTLSSLGIKPDGMIGHSVGELGCAYADKCFTAEQTVLAAYWRGRSIQEAKLPPGAMAAVGLTWEQAKTQCPDGVLPACHNAKDNVTISGPVDTIKQFVADLTAKEVFAREVKSSGVAFHSRYIAAAGPALRQHLLDVIPVPRARSSKWISSSIPEASWDTPLASMSDAAYHVNNLLSPVLFQEALAHIPAGAVTIEVSAHALLQGILRRSLDQSCKIIPLMKRQEANNLNFFLTNIGKLYMSGLNPSISNMYQPTFPVPVGTPMLSPLIQQGWDHAIPWGVAQLDQFSSTGGGGGTSAEVKVDVNSEQDKHLTGHKIDGRVLFPATGYLVCVWRALAKSLGKLYEDIPVLFEDVAFRRATILTNTAVSTLSISILEGSGRFEVREGKAVIVSGKISVPQDTVIPQVNNASTAKEREAFLTSAEVYKELRLRGYDYNNQFQGIKSANTDGSGGYLAWTGNWISYLDTMLQMSILGEKKRHLYLPTRLQWLKINPQVHTQRVQEAEKSDEIFCFSERTTSSIVSGGVDLQGLKASIAPKRGSGQNPQLESYSFTPYTDNVTCTKDTGMSSVVALLLYNIHSRIVNIVQHTQEQEENSLAKLISDKIYNQPLQQASVEIKESLSSGDSDVGKCHLLITSSKADITTELISELKTSSFILLLEEQPRAPGLPGLTTVFNCKSDGQQWTLLRKVDTLPAAKTIHLSSTCTTDYSWIHSVQSSLVELKDTNTRLWIISDGAQDDSGIFGFSKCVKAEPGGDRLRIIFNRQNGKLNQSVVSAIMASDMFMNVVSSSGVTGFYAHHQLTTSAQSQAVKCAYINTTTKGDLTSLSWIQSQLQLPASNSAKDPNKTICQVDYAPLNFRDIMIATGRLAADALPGDLAGEDCVLGLEFAGRQLDTKQRVMGLVPARGLATYVEADPGFMWNIPDSWSLEQASTVPVVYSTAYYALVVRAGLRAGESVLIHSASGGVGQAAVSIALSMNCEVFVTVGSNDKKQFLLQRFPKLEASHILNSRSVSFEFGVKRLTSGRGVDVALNSLAGDMLQATVRCVAEHGRFCEIGKYDLSENTPLGMSVFLKNITFHGILLDALFDCPHDKNKVVSLVNDGIKKGVVRPLPVTVYHHSDMEKAFRFMASGKHIGKVVLQVRRSEDEVVNVDSHKKNYCDPKQVYVIIGGLGGFGMELSDWLIKRGAAHLVLTSRRGVSTAYQRMRIATWQAAGVNIVISTLDASNESQAKQLIQLASKHGQVGGIFNLAMVLRDSLLENQTEKMFCEVAAGKIVTTHNLDKLSRSLCKHLQWFVVFSSISGGKGNPGQSNYGWANSSMEHIMEKRNRENLHGLAIQWGAIGDVGVVSERMGGNEVEIGGTFPQRMESCLASLDTLLLSNHPVVCSYVPAKKEAAVAGGNAQDLSLAVARVMGIADVSLVNPKSTLGELGMDSLMSVEVKQNLEAVTGKTYENNDVLALTFNKLKELSASGPGESEGSTKGASNSAPKLSDHFQIPTKCLREMAVGTGPGRLYIVHPIEGNTDKLALLASKLQCTVYGIECVQGAPLTTIEELATYYIKEMQAVNASRDFYLAGYSFGASVAFEMSLQLQRAATKHQPKALLLLDGSHNFVSQQIEHYKNRSQQEREIDAIAAFTLQFNLSLDMKQIREKLTSLTTWDARMELMSTVLKIDTALLSHTINGFLERFNMSGKYTPVGHYTGAPVLIKASNNPSKDRLGESYGLQDVCTKPVAIYEVEGTHDSFLEGKSAEKVAKIMTTHITC